MKKQLVALCLIVCIIFTMTSVYADTTQGSVIADVLNVRSSAQISENNIIGSLYYASSVTIIGYEDGWYKILYGNDAGYVKCEYIVEGETVSKAENTDLVLNQSYVYETAKGNQIVEYAKTFIGVPYVYGGSSPSGFDCSGFTSYIYKQFGVNLYRVANDQAKNGYVVERDELIPGDIILFARNGSYINHVGIYVGNNSFIHAPQTGRNVEITSMASGYYDRCYFGARRIFI